MFFKILGGRQLPTLGDIEMAFKTQNVSLVELNDYMRQVQKLPLPPQVIKTKFFALENSIF